MRNKREFIYGPLPQPAFYKNCFNAWCAVYFDAKTDEEYHLQLVLCPWSWQDGYKHAKAVQILRQTPKHRTMVDGKEYTTIKAAVERLSSLIELS